MTGAAESNHSSTRPYWLTAGALLVLLSFSIITAVTDLGRATTAIALAIAAIKVTLVAAYFMHLTTSSGAMRVFAAAGLFWLAILFGLTLIDYTSRHPHREMNDQTVSIDRPWVHAQRLDSKGHESRK